MRMVFPRRMGHASDNSVNDTGQVRHVKDKIRQQLQVFRDRNLLLHVDRNCWRIDSK